MHSVFYAHVVLSKKNVLSNVCLVFLGARADTILTHAKAWDLVLWNCPRHSTTLWSASTFICWRAWLHEPGCFGVPRWLSARYYMRLASLVDGWPERAWFWCDKGLMSRAGLANTITWKNLSSVCRDPGTAIPGSRLTGLARLSYNRKVDFYGV